METNNENRKPEREKLIQHLISSGYLKNKAAIKAMLEVPRHKFIPSYQSESAYEDCPLTLGCGQTISAPHMVAIMTEALDVQPKNKILEIGAGSGYQAAILAEIAKKGKVYTLERIPEIAKLAKENLSELDYKNIIVILNDGTQGYKDKAPYDRVIVTAAAPKIPPALINQLKSPGKLLIPVGGRGYQDLLLVEKKNHKIKQKNLGGCVFVPLIGKDGW